MDTRTADRDITVDHDTVADRAARRGAALDGVRAIAPLVAGLAPLALTIGASSARADLPPLVGWLASPLLYGASGQLTLVHVLAHQGSSLVAVAAVAVVNLQMVIYGTAMRPYWRHEPRWRRAWFAQLLVSPVFAVTSAHHRDEPDPRLRTVFYATSALTLWTAWAVLTAVGYGLGGVIDAPVLTVLAPLVLMVLARRSAVDGPTLVALGVGASAAIAASAVPHGLGFVGAGLLGILAGAAVERRGMPTGRPVRTAVR